MKTYVIDAIEKYGMLQKGANVIVALSGGADSMALLNVLLSLKDELNINVEAAHLNHMIRGAEADRDENFVRDFCSKKGIKLYCKSIDIPKFAKENGISLELAARQKRYEFLSEVCNGVVATAHTASDNLETIIFNLTRGSGLDGLCAIPPKRDIFIRPLLFCTRQMIEEYCQDNNIPFVIDSTNNETEYTRNKIRHNIVPILKEINPSVENTVIKTTDILRENVKLIDSLSSDYLKENVLDNGNLSVKKLRDINPLVAKTVLKKYISIKNSELSLENIHIEAIFNAAISGGRTSLPKKCSAVCFGGEFYLEQSSLDIDYNVEITEINAETFEKTKKINNLLLNDVIDCDKIVGKLTVRTRNEKDSIRLKNRGCTKTINKLFNELKVPLIKRDILPVVSDEKGVVWICGIGVAQRVAVTNATKNFLLLKGKEVQKES